MALLLEIAPLHSTSRQINIKTRKRRALAYRLKEETHVLKVMSLKSARYTGWNFSH